MQSQDTIDAGRPNGAKVKIALEDRAADDALIAKGKLALED